MRKSYIGITGFMSSDEVRRVLMSVPLDIRRLIMIGVLASSKTIRGLKNKWPNRYPEMDRIANIFPIDLVALNLIHYHTKEEDTLGVQLIAMTEFGGVNFHGFQLNIAWPSLQVLTQYRKLYPSKQIVLQVGRHAFKMVGDSPERLAKKVAEYDGVTDYVLLDPSGGRGKSLDQERMQDYLRALTALNLEMGLGVAGGLGPDTLHLVELLAKEFPDLSTDAEGLLRDKKDRLNTGKAKQYVAKTLEIFKD